MARDDKKKPGEKRDLRGPLIGGAVVIGLGLGIFLLSQNISGVSRPSAPPAPTVNLLPPPPPPPPPPPLKEQPPPPENKPEETPKPEDQPKPDNAPKQLTIAGPAQAGGDAFGIGAGRGGGSSVIGGSGDGGGGGTGGGGFEEAAYAHFLSSEIQQAVQSNLRIDRMFNTADVAIWVDGAGRVTRAKLRHSTGNDKIDQEIVATLERMRPLSDPPPPQFKFPREVKIRGARG